jgi:DNA-binding transcriptional LysR family regulator
MGVGFGPGRHQVHGVNLGLRRIRRRQHSLTRVVLALFCAAWLQAAIVPCVMAHAADLGPAAQPQAHHQHDAHAGHQHGATAPEQHAASASHPCLYCPPAETGAPSCEGHGGCAYPHDPQVDARAAGVLWVAVPASFVTPSPATLIHAIRADAAVADVVPTVSLSVSYCRFIE